MGIKEEPIILSGDECQPIEIEDNIDSQSDVFIPTHGGDQTDQLDNLVQEDTCQSYDTAYMDTEEPEIGNL